VIEGDAPWQARGEFGASEHQLLGFHRGIGRIETGRALDLEAAQDVNNGDQTDVPHSRHRHAALGIEFPLVMGCAFRLDRWGGQFTLLLLAPRELLGVEQCRDAGATWQGVLCPAEINSSFRQ
jgi:hypothetical protein